MTDVRTKGYRRATEDIVGQGGTPVAVNESVFTTDEVILDPNGPLAVQIPEGVGADTTRNTLGLADALAGDLPEGEVVGPPQHSVPELVRTHNAQTDVADLSPGAKKDEPAEDEPNPEEQPDA